MRWNVKNSEMELVDLAREGDREAYWRLVQPHLHALLIVARTILRNLGDAEEVAQESVLKGFCQIQGFRGEAKLSTWLIQITINEAKCRLRKDRRFLYRSLEEPRTANGDEYSPRDFTDWRELSSEALEHKELRQALEHALASLPEKYREVFTLRDIAHLSADETAQALGLTLGNVKTRLLRARLQMRDALAPGFGGSWSKNAVHLQRARA